MTYKQDYYKTKESEIDDFFSGIPCSHHELKNTPDIFCKISHIIRLIAWTPSRLALAPALRGRYQSLLYPSLPKAIYGTNNQE